MNHAGFVALVLAFWLACTTVVVWLFLQPRPRPQEPPKAPLLDCGCVKGVAKVVCLACSRTSCAEHIAHSHDDGFERARPLTEVGPLVVAGSDLDRTHQPMSLVNLTLRLMVDADPELAAMNARAETLAGLYVAPEADR